MRIKITKSQSFIEYAVLIAIIAISVSAMTKYIYNSVRARNAHAWADIYHPQTGVR